MMTDAAKSTEGAGTEERRNYALVFSGGVAATTAGQLANATLVLPFLYLALGAPVLFAGLLLPIMQGSELVAELFGAPFLESRKRAKISVVVPTLVSAAALALIAFAAEGSPKSVVVGLFLTIAIVVGLCDGIVTLGYGQLFGVVIPSEQRGGITFFEAMIAGALAIAIAWLTKDLLAADQPLQRHIVVLWAGIVAMVVGGVIIVGVRVGEAEEEKREEEAAEPAAPPTHGSRRRHRRHVLPRLKGPDILQSLRHGLQVGMKHVWFRRYTVACVLFLSVVLAMPFYTIHAASYHKGSTHGLTVLVIAASAGIVVGSPLWAYLSKRSNRTVVILGSFIAAASAMVALGLDFTHLAGNLWLYAIVIFMLAFGANGVSESSYLYLIEMSSESERPSLLALSDVAVGVLAVGVAAVLGIVAHFSNPTIPLMVLLVANILAGIYAIWLIEPGAAKPAA
jgi:Major Facilitator Superfamily